MLQRSIVLAAFAATAAFGQVAFESASVKPSDPAAGPFAMTRGGPGTKDPGRIRYANMPLKYLLVNAYGVKDFQIAGPGWIEQDRFDVEATMRPDTTPEQFRRMLANLLLERFKLVLHRDTKDAPAYTLVAAKNGPKMAESAPAAVPADAPQQIERDREGFPKLAPGGPPEMLQFVVGNRARLAARQQSMGDLAARLAELLERSVADGTGLTEKYDFTLTFASEGTALGRSAAPVSADTPRVADSEPPPDLLNAVQFQLGLKLEAKKGSVEIIVIDRAERKPAAN